MQRNNLRKSRNLICGIHSCQETLKVAPETILKVYLLVGKTYPEWIKNIDNRIVSYVSKDYLNNLLKNKNIVHQGIVFEVSVDKSALHFDVNNINGNVVILDNVTDPHNVGAIIRSAAVFGINSIILHSRTACGLSGTVTKTSSGGLNHVNVYNVNNIGNTIKELKKCGFWVVALSEKGNCYLHEVDLHGKICLILGSESSGIRRLQLENSDFIAKLPTTSYFSTLNVSNAAAVAFYEIARQNEFKMG